MTRVKYSDALLMRGDFKEYLNQPQYLVYNITNISNNTQYVGASKNLKIRLFGYISAINRAKTNLPIINAFRKYGFPNFSMNIISLFDTEDNMYDFEIAKISDLKNSGKLYYNISDGGKTSFSYDIMPKGISHKSSKLSLSDIEHIFYLYHIDNKSIKQIALEIDIVTNSTVSRILNGDSYKMEIGPLISKYGRIRNLSQAHQINKKVGDNKNSSKLSEDDVLEILRLYYEQHISCAKIAKNMGVAPTTIIAIKLGKNWSWLTKDIISGYLK